VTPAERLQLAKDAKASARNELTPGSGTLTRRRLLHAATHEVLRLVQQYEVKASKAVVEATVKSCKPLSSLRATSYEVVVNVVQLDEFGNEVASSKLASVGEWILDGGTSGKVSAAVCTCKAPYGRLYDSAEVYLSLPPVNLQVSDIYNDAHPFVRRVFRRTLWLHNSQEQMMRYLRDKLFERTTLFGFGSKHLQRKTQLFVTGQYETYVDMEMAAQLLLHALGEVSKDALPPYHNQAYLQSIASNSGGAGGARVLASTRRGGNLNLPPRTRASF
jgi:hypothetical protein